VLKTNAVRVPDRLGMKYELRAYEVNPDDLSAEREAAKVGLQPGQVSKTLVVHGNRTGIYLAVIPANAEIDFKALAQLTGDKRLAWSV
jgi:Cys-tRNA(Pro)/Cys-tRNA(Cys) deacylase